MMLEHNHTKFITLFDTEIMRLYPVLPPHPKLPHLWTPPKLSFLDWCIEQFHDAVISRTGLSNAVQALVVSDTMVFLLNEYFVELNKAKFKFLNLFLN